MNIKCLQNDTFEIELFDLYRSMPNSKQDGGCLPKLLFCTTWNRSIAKYLTVATYPFEIGLIIDAFGELRDQQEQVREDMEVWKEHHIFPFLLLI